jgi:hypothetical protein
MAQVILRKTNAATVSADAAAALVEVAHPGRLIHRGGDSMLIECDAAEVRALQDALQGWVVSPQTATIPLPDTRLGLEPRVS